MGLSNELISQFAKVTKVDMPVAKESTVWGTAVEYGGTIYVRFDGADRLTPISTTTNIKPGERVLVTIKNRSAVVTGNISSPTASSSELKDVEHTMSDTINTNDIEAIYAIFASLESKVAQFDNMEAINAEIEKLKATYADLDYISAKEIETLTLEAEKIKAAFGEFTDISASDLEAINADIDNLIAYNANFTYVSAEVLKAVKADIGELNVNKLSAKEADLKYANIDFTNIGIAAVEELFAKSGIIKDLVVDDQKITGELVGVTIKGDLIEGNTIKADKLVVKGEDGLYYKLNVNSLGETTAKSDPKYQNGLDGSVIIAESITAEKVSVKDLVAFHATIGGFHITDDSLYSGAKESVNNTTRGIYQDSSGQFAVGDSINYLKFFKDTDDQYKLDISASIIRFGVPGEKEAYMELTDDGLVVGNSIGGDLQGNILVDEDSVDIRVGDKVSASYQGKDIYLGKDSADAVIDLCDGTGKIANYSYGGNEARTLWMHSNGSIRLDSMYENALYSNTTTFNDDGSENHYSSSMTLQAYADYAESEDLANEVRGTSINDCYTKLEYTDGSSTNTSMSMGSMNINGYDKHSEIDLHSEVLYEDYREHATISLTGKRYIPRKVDDSEAYEGETYSYIALDAGKIHLLADELLVSKRAHSEDSASGIKRVLLSSANSNGYWGMVTPEGSDSGWIRTTSSGIIPYSMDSENGKSSLGSSSWPFANLHVRKVNDTITMDSDGDITIPNGHAYYGTNKSGASRSLVYMNSGNNTIVGYGGYANSEGQTNIYGQKIGIYVKTTNGDKGFKPYFEPGDTLSIMCRPVGFITDSKKSVWFDIPLHKIALGCNAVTVASAYGLIIRHNGVYLYGSSVTSSGNTYAKPTKYTADLADGCGIVRIRADFTADSNATNNDPVSLIASVKITFS